MKRIKRVSIFDNSLNKLLSANEMTETIGGQGYGQMNNCFFDCIAYISKKYGRTEYNPSDYCNDYHTGNLRNDDGWSGSRIPGDCLYGPEVNESSYNYFGNYFETSGNGWATGSDITSLVNGSGTTMGAFTYSGGDLHAVILESYSDGYYSYYDPSSGSYSRIKASEVKVAANATGIR
jgi:hypothetical protein